MRIRLFNPFLCLIMLVPIILFLVTCINEIDISNIALSVIWLCICIWYSGMFSFIEIKDDYMEHFGLLFLFYHGARTIMYEEIKNISGQHIVGGLELLHKRNHNWILLNSTNICIGRFQIIAHSEKKLQRIISEIINHCADISVNQEISTFLETGVYSFKE